VRIARKFWNSILSSVTVTRTSKASVNGPDQHIEKRRELAGPLLESLDKSLASTTVLRPLEESVFIRRGDYWMIRYQGQAAILKATRGLDCLCSLLRHPARDVHVSELLATPSDLPLPGFFQDAGPILDSQAKAEYKRRINELRDDLEEAKQFNDSYRAARTRSELDAVAEQLATAVGLGGRNRRTSSNAERARCAVTKCIKKAIQKIGEAMPSLGYHLAARIKTGYFCSYNPHPDRPVAWKF